MEKIKNSKKIICEILCLVIGIAMSVVGLYFYHPQYLCYEYTPLLFILGVVSALGCGLISVPIHISKSNSKKQIVLKASLVALLVVLIIIGLMLLINLVAGNMELYSAVICVSLTGIVTAVLSFIAVLKMFNKKIVRAILSFAVISGLIAGGYLYVIPQAREIKYSGYIAPAPATGSVTDTQDISEITDGDFYVSTKGSDNNNGSKEAPFLTIEKAIEAVRKTDKSGRDGITVCIEGGEYRVDSLEFTEKDSGTKECPVTYCSYNGEVIINGGVTLLSDDFESVKNYPEYEKRLSEDAQENVVVIDLTKKPYSLTKDDWGRICAIGSYHTANSYDGDYVGSLYCELFVDDIRQILARYPDNDYLYTEEVVKTGLGKESDGALTEVQNWSEIRNPESDIYRVNADLAKKISGWENLDEVWMFGFWKYDWADASTPIGSFNPETSELSPKFVSLYGTKTDAPYYFFNVFEELTTEGEWYLDREKGLLFLWKSKKFDNVQIDLSLSLNPVVNSTADYITFDGITFKGTREDGVTITGDNNKVQNCVIKNVAGNALVMTGSNNLAFNNEITRTGKGGIIIDGGAAETLTPGNSVADNNYIHHWSEIYQTYQPGVMLLGVGNVCSHNEFHDSPHEAVSYKGNNHIVEYNDIHDVCLLSDDAGAIYSGRSWVWYGNIIRYNAVYNIGSENHTPDGIYLDDALSGQTVHGNIIINVPSNSLHIGGGRDNVITNNIIVTSGENSIRFDDRAREGALERGWFTHAYTDTGDMWEALYNSPWQSETWQNAFPEYTVMTDDVEKSDSPEYIPNPSSTIKGNIIVNKTGDIGDVWSEVYRFSDISENEMYSLNKIDEIFEDAENGNYNIKDIEKLKENISEFENIPYEKIGRIAK